MKGCMVAAVSLEIVFFIHFYWKLILKFDPANSLIMNAKTKGSIGILSGVYGLEIGFFLQRWGMAGQFCCGILAAYLIAASIMDIQTSQVYDFLPAITAAVGITMLLFTRGSAWIPSMVLFFLIQAFLFMRMYGRADGYAFLVCAIFESRYGRGLLPYLLHMGAAFFLLGTVQLWKRNVNRRGNLKRPVPFLPYIMATVWLFL